MLLDPLESVQLVVLITHRKAECVESRVRGHDTDCREGVVVGIPKSSDSFIFLGKRNQESGRNVAGSLWKEMKVQLRSVSGLQSWV